VRAVEYRPAHRQPAQRRQHQQVHQRLALRPHPRPLDPLAQPPAIQRPLPLERAHDRRHAALGRVRRHALLGQTPSVAGEQSRRRQRVQPRVVLAGHQVQRAPVQPCDQQRALLAERTIDVRRAHAAAARADRQAHAARVLPLHRQQAPRHRHRIPRPRARQQLRGQALGRHPPLGRRAPLGHHPPLTGAPRAAVMRARRSSAG
jgi:hypothetical protein